MPIFQGETKRVGELFTRARVCTADAATDTFTAAGHALLDGDPVVLSAVAGAVPGGLVAGQTYYVVGAATDTFQLASAPGGPPVPLTSGGGGTLQCSGPADPPALRLIVAPPSGAKESFEYGAGVLQRLSRGVYYADYTFALSGEYALRWEADHAAGTEVDQISLRVLQRNTPV